MTISVTKEPRQINALYFADGAPPLLIWMTPKEKSFLRIKIEACLELVGKIPIESSTFASHGFMLSGVWINPKQITRISVIDEKSLRDGTPPIEFQIE